MKSNFIVLFLLVGSISYPTRIESQNLYLPDDQESVYLFDCDISDVVDVDYAKFLLRKSRNMYMNSKDTLLSIYCYAERSGIQELKANSLVKLAAYTMDHENDDRMLSLIHI